MAEKKASVLEKKASVLEKKASVLEKKASVMEKKLSMARPSVAATAGADTSATAALGGEDALNLTPEEALAAKEAQERLEIRALPVRQYLEATVVPLLLHGLQLLAIERPENPVDFLAQYLIGKNPMNQKNPLKEEKRETEEKKEEKEVIKEAGTEVIKETGTEVTKETGTEVIKEAGTEVVKETGTEVIKEEGKGEKKE